MKLSPYEVSSNGIHRHNSRDAKLHWGLEDFMNVKETAVTNAANLSFFMVNFSQALLQPFGQHQPDYSVLDLKPHYRGFR
jgi:putative transposase